VVGAVCALHGREWSSLSFVGANQCRIPVDLGRTRHDLLRRLVSNEGERVIDFIGSVYRGFKVMLDAHLLPIVLPLAIETDQDATGLAVCDFRFAAAPLEVVLEINSLVRSAVDRRMNVSIENVDLPDDEFRQLFGVYLSTLPDAG